MSECPTNGSERADRFMVVVDGDANHLFYTAILLQRFEYRVCTAKTASEAIEMMAVAVPSLVITAHRLPDMSGTDLVTRLREDPRTAAVPIIVLTAEGDLVVEQRSIQAGASACLSKPVRAEDLYRAVQAATEFPRRNVRISTRLPVTVNGMPLDGVEGECASVLSEHGMYVRTLRPSQVNSTLAVTMVVKGRSVSADAVVLYRHAFGEGPFREPGMGLKFVRMDQEDQELIRQYIRDEITRGIGPGQSRQA